MKYKVKKSLLARPSPKEQGKALAQLEKLLTLTVASRVDPRPRKPKASKVTYEVARATEDVAPVVPDPERVERLESGLELRWRPVADFPLYECSHLGEIRNRYSKHVRPPIEHYMVPGYYIVHVSRKELLGDAKNGKLQWKQRGLAIHKVWYETFVGPIPPRHTLKARDRDLQNFDVANWYLKKREHSTKQPKEERRRARIAKMPHIVRLCCGTCRRPFYKY